MFDLNSLFRLLAGYKKNIAEFDSPVKLQEKTLRGLLRRAKNTKFGEEHNFNAIKSVSDYQKQVPLRKYEDFWEKYWRPSFPILDNITWPGVIPYFCLSSGTSSGSTKYIPYTNEMIRSNSKAGLDLLIFHLLNRPKSKLFSGKSFVLGGSTDLNELAPGIFGGDLSGIAAKTLPWWAKYFYFPSAEMALISNWEKKIDILAENALKEKITSLSGIPSWILILLEKMAAISGRKDVSVAELFPNLQMLVHGGVNFEPYYEQFMKLLEGSNAELREVYPASEGFIAIADKGYGQGLKLNYKHDIFFEFIPVEELDSPNPTRHWLRNIELEQNYAIVLTTAAGLWSYIWGDTLKFIKRPPPRLLVTGRTSYFLSAFGEHLTGEEVEKAVSSAAAAIGKNINEYSLGALYPAKTGELGGHLLVVEFTNSSLGTHEEDNFKRIFKDKLCELNEDYKAHLAEGFGMKAPELKNVKEGTFAAWMKSRGKLGGQNKVPRIIAKKELFDNLQSFIS